MRTASCGRSVLLSNSRYGVCTRVHDHNGPCVVCGVSDHDYSDVFKHYESQCIDCHVKLFEDEAIQCSDCRIHDRFLQTHNPIKSQYERANNTISQRSRYKAGNDC